MFHLNNSTREIQQGMKLVKMFSYCYDNTATLVSYTELCFHESLEIISFCYTSNQLQTVFISNARRVCASLFHWKGNNVDFSLCQKDIHYIIVLLTIPMFRIIMHKKGCQSNSSGTIDSITFQIQDLNIKMNQEWNPELWLCHNTILGTRHLYRWTASTTGIHQLSTYSNSFWAKITTIQIRKIWLTK